MRRGVASPLAAFGPTHAPIVCRRASLGQTHLVQLAAETKVRANASAARRAIARRAERAHLNNLYGLIPPPGRRRFFWPRLAEWRRVSRTLFVNWFTWLIFRTVFGHKFRAGPPYNDQKWEPIYLFFLSAKIRAQYMYFSMIFFSILGPGFGLNLECHLFK